MAATAMETTLVLVKPDGVQRGLVGEILGRFERKGLQVAGLRLARLSRETLERHYGEHRQKPFFAGLVAFMGSGPVVVAALRGLNAVSVVRSLMGKTFGKDAAPGTIRGDLAISSSFNLVHGSDSPESAARELALFFGPGEVLDYPVPNRDWVYDVAAELS
jgi:nucleoside-diphosphate kinase